jgi:biopolymer transport protein ExbB
MKNIFNVIVIVLSMAVAYSVFEFWMGDTKNFADPATRRKPLPGNTVGMIYTGGPIVAILMGLILVSSTFSIERYLSINKAKGKGDTSNFIKGISENLLKENYDEALQACEAQRGSLANIMRAAIERFKDVKDDNSLDKEKKMSEVQRSIDEATNLEVPLLEKNLVILSTVASIATMFGLLGTTMGMIRAFAAFGDAGTVDATALAVGISEALYNTAAGLIGAIISIIFFNLFTTRVDALVYMIDEAILSITQIFTVRVSNK